MIQFLRQISGKLNSNIYAGIQGTFNPQHLSFIRNLQKEMQEKNYLDTPMQKLRVVIFDLETTGFFPQKGDRVLSIGAIKMTGATIEQDETFYSLLKSELPLSDEIITLTNLTDNEIQNAPEAKQVLIQFFQFVNSDILVAHHSIHEKTFMQKLTWDLLKISFGHRIIDTSFLIRLSNPPLRSMSLDEICKECEIEINNRHHALGDAIMTAQIWGYYLKKAQEKGFKTMREVYEFLVKN
ncbi:exonuclease domain-containing protein [Bacillus xiapuensis]|uniref:Exonuclease domain-containing protein n=1 Tax=Bacillus xiapuensis TaxID=2014075 RepID=A0ABU6N957_9BACI|nr:exonuclease domain-containing protein [Bacillus xiapuensis]